MNKFYVSLNGDKIGGALGQHILNDDIESLSQFSQKIDSAIKQICQAAEQMGGRTIICSGDEALLEVDESFLEHLYDAIDHFKEVTGFGCTVGIGQSISEASKALIYGKLNDVGHVTQYHPELEEELKQFDESPEDNKMGDDYDDAEDMESPEEVGGYDSEQSMDDESGDGDFESEELLDNDVSEEEGDAGVGQSFEGEYEDDEVLPESEGQLDGRGIEQEEGENNDEEFIEEDESMDEESEEEQEMPEGEMQDEDMSEQEELPIEDEEIAEEEEDQPQDLDFEESEEMDEQIPTDEEAFEDEEGGIGEDLEEESEEISDEEAPELSEEDLMGEEEMSDEMPMEEGEEEDAEYAHDDEMENEDGEILVHGEEESEQEPVEEVDDKGILAQMMEAAQDSGGDKQALKQKVLGILQRFKQDKHIIEQAKETNPEHYQNIMEMLNSMIEMARHLVDNPEEAAQVEQQPEMEQQEEQESIIPQDLASSPKM